MAIVVPAFVVTGIALFMNGLFRSLWEGDSNRLTGKLLIALSVVSLSLGGLGALSVVR
jgi:hypothetical protein